MTNPKPRLKSLPPRIAALGSRLAVVVPGSWRTSQQTSAQRGYLLEPNGKKAAITAGYSKAGAEVAGSRLLRHPAVAAEMVRRQKILQVKSGITPEMVVAELAKLGFSDIRQVVEWQAVDRVIGQLRGGIVSQPEGFLITITTQSERPPAGVFRAELMKARKVRDGTLKSAILPVIFEFPPDVDWRDSKNWHMVTPNEGRSISVARLIPDYDQAEASGEEEMRRWASQHLNVEIGLALHSDRWAGADYWEAQGRREAGLTLDQLIARCEVIDIGVDGGGLDDLLGLAVVGRDRLTREWLLWTHAWAHPSVLKRRQVEAPRFRDFADDKDLTFVDKSRLSSGTNSLSVDVDMGGVDGFLEDLVNEIDSAVRPAAQAGAQVIYDAAKLAVPVSQHAHWFYGTHDRYLFKAGTLRDSIYQAFSADNSGQDHATYHISWNYRKCPYGFMVEFGTISAPARPFIRRAAEKGEQAMDAAEKKFMELIHGPGA